MRYRILTTWALWALLMVGCDKSEPIGESAGSVDNGGLISFSLSSEIEAYWTKGSETNDISEVEALQVYSYATAGSWAEADVAPYFTTDILTPFTLTQNSSTWTYNIGARYWPADGRLLSFFTYYPESELTVSTDDNDRPEYSYTLNPLSRYNDDLLVNATYDLTKESNDNSDLVTLELQHALTKITLQAKLKGELYSEGDTEYSTNDKFVINGLEFYDIYDNAILSIDEDGIVSWAVDTESSIELSSTQGQTLLDVTDEDAELNYDSYIDVMEEGKAIFVLPQTLSAVREANDGVAPTVKVRVRRTFNAILTDGSTTSTSEDETEIIYESEITTIPAPTVAEISGGTGSGSWDPGQHVRYSFEFDVSDLSLYETPLTITSEVLNWTEATVTADIHSNLYVYSSLNEIAIAITEETAGDEVADADKEYCGEFQICTNYDYNLRVPHHREELGGTITSSRGFLFCSNDFPDAYYPYTNHVGTYDVDGVTYKIFVPTLLSVTDDATYEIVYASATFDENEDVESTNFDDITDLNIYEYADGYNAVRSSAPIGTTADIVYGSNGYAYVMNTSTGNYRLLYIDPKESALTAFNYTDVYYEDETYHEIVLENFASTDEKTVSYKINIGKLTTDGTGDDYTFDFSVTRSDRDTEGLYVSTAISNNTSYGVNKEGDDAVYTLTLSVDPAHLLKTDDDDGGVSYSYGSFDDIISVEMISNGGGMITTLFPVTLTDSNYVIAIPADDYAASLGLK